MVVEVVSTSSVRKDLVHLRAAYARAGIPEYWLIDARGSEIRFELLTLAEGEYRLERPDQPEQRSAVLARSFVLERQNNRVGRFQYRLRATG